MRDVARHRWIALFAGLLLLVGTTVLERGRAAAASHRPTGDERALSESAIRSGVVAALAAKAPTVNSQLSDRIAASIARCEREQSLAPDLVLAVLMQESSARPGAHSPKGAIGLMQVMPHMFEVLALPGSAAHVEANIEAGCRLLADNIRRLGEDDGISAYFWGNAAGNDRYLGNVKKLRRDFRPYVAPEVASARISG